MNDRAVLDASSVSQGYVAAMLHDVKKVLLNAQPGEKFGTWRPDHKCLADLSTQHLGPDDQPKALDLEPDTDEVELVRLHHGIRQWRESYEEPDGTPPEQVLQNHPATVLALTLADRIHKALYFTETEATGDIRGTNWSCPFYYPFWGDGPEVGAVRWTPETAHEAFSRRVYRELTGKLSAPGARLTAPFLVRLNRTLRDFPESTYLPVTSICFHHQLTAALYLMLMKHFAEQPELQLTNNACDFGFPLQLTVIETPAERLRYRLRDAAHIRKLSHELGAAIHRYFREQYLDLAWGEKLAARDFRHPDADPFIFYSRDAAVILNRPQDEDALRRIGENVAKTWESALSYTLFDIETHTTIRGQGNTVRVTDYREAEHLQPGRAAATAGTPRRLRVAHVAAVADKTPQRCALCGKSLLQGDFHRDALREEDLCSVCFRVRFEFLQCGNEECATLFPAGQYTDDRCPHCQTAGEQPRSAGWFLQREATGRVAWIAVAIGCTRESMLVETEKLLSRFRVERLDAEQKGEVPGTGSEPAVRLAQVHGTGGVLEYLQAVLDIDAHQRRWESALERIAQLGAKEARALFVYSSPTLIVIVLDEDDAPAFLQFIREDLKALQLTHRLHVTFCDGRTPMREALRDLFTGSGETARPPAPPPEMQDLARRIHKQARQLYQHNANDAQQAAALIEQCRDLNAKAAQDTQEFGVRVVRGGQERRFGGAQADVLASEMRWTQDAGAQLAQLGALADALRTIGGEDARHGLLLDLDARLNHRHPKIGDELAEIVRAAAATLPLSTFAGFARELAGRRTGEADSSA